MSSFLGMFFLILMFLSNSVISDEICSGQIINVSVSSSNHLEVTLEGMPSSFIDCEFSDASCDKVLSDLILKKLEKKSVRLQLLDNQTCVENQGLVSLMEE